MTFGLTPQGFNTKRLSDIIQDLQNAMIAQFGDINVSPQSVFGQLIGVLAKQYADLWENEQDVYFSEYPNSASGSALDNVVQFNGLTRLPATKTTALGVCAGNEGTVVTAGSFASIAGTNNIFSNANDGIITSSAAYSVTVYVSAAAPQIYNTIINNQNFIFSLPVITFTGDFVASNSIVVSINGVNQTAVPFTVDNDTTLAAIATQIALNPNVASATPSASHVISIVPVLGKSVTIRAPVQITGGISQPTSAVTFATPSNVNQISQYLTAVINSGTPSWEAIDLTGSFMVTSLRAADPISVTVQSNLDIIARSSAILFSAQDFGPIPCPANSLTQILTPLAGWSTINNPEAGITGRFIETDSALRIRRALSISLAGNGTVEAIRAHLLEVTGVTSVSVFENQTMIQSEIDIVFSIDFVASNTITFDFNGRTLPTITYAMSNAATMTQLALLLALQPEVASCVVSGSNTLEITAGIFQEIEIDNISILGGLTQPNYVITGGRPPKSFEAVVEGGDEDEIAEEIWLSKPAGIQTFGNINNGNGIDIIDSQGNTQVIFFSRPTPIYIWITVVLTLYSEENFPTDGLSLVQQAILNYGNSLGVGADVLLQRVLCQIFNVPGVASGVMQMAFTTSASDSPSYSSSDISIADNQISVWDTARIVVTV